MLSAQNLCDFTPKAMIRIATLDKIFQGMENVSKSNLKKKKKQLPPLSLSHFFFWTLYKYQLCV